nr:hypothetical protein [Oxalobacteraceae bacterium]
LFVFFLYIVANIWHGTEAEGVMGRAETFTVWNNVFPGAALLTAYLGVILYRVVFEQAEARATRGVMGKYLSPAVMTEVLKDPDHLELGGVKRDMTVLFSDIRGFTSVSEKMDPQWSGFVAGRSKCTTCGRINRVQSVPLLRGENDST